MARWTMMVLLVRASLLVAVEDKGQQCKEKSSCFSPGDAQAGASMLQVEPKKSSSSFPGAASTTNGSTDCWDKPDFGCPRLAQIGQCSSLEHNETMQENCRLSCNFCNGQTTSETPSPTVVQATPPPARCENSCSSSNDGRCDDGGPASMFALCELGTDCADCGDERRSRCPSGYALTLRDLNGHGKQWTYGVDNITACATLCNSRIGCSSFEYNAKSRDGQCGTYTGADSNIGNKKDCAPDCLTTGCLKTVESCSGSYDPVPSATIPTVDDTAVDMAWLAMAIYDKKSTVTGRLGTYNLKYISEDSFEGNSTDYFGLYTRDDVCVIAVAGSDDPEDWNDNFHTASRTGPCGIRGVHEGFSRETTEFLTSSMYTLVMRPYITCNCKKVYLAGHSLGGAKATLIAGCVGKNHSWTPFPIHGLYTIGAPGASSEQITDPNGDCIPGLRSYNYDDASGDVVPASTYFFGMRHPKLPTMRLKDRCRNSGIFGLCQCCESDGISTMPRPCDSLAAKNEPAGIGVPISVADHFGYETRLNQCVGNSGPREQTC